VHLHGVGATVPRALFAKWAEQYSLIEPAVTLTYAAEGSGAGVRGAEEGSADFGVSDSPLSDRDLASHQDVRHVPLAVEAIAIVYTLQAIPSSVRLQLTEDLLADVLLGRVTSWDDAAIAAVNPGVKLPHTPLRVVYRGDESGASSLLSEWLAQTSHRWSLPSTRSLSLPVGAPVQKDDGMVARLRATDGSLGYVSAVTAISEHLATFAVRNPAGRFVAPSLEGMRAAAATARLTPDLRAHATAASGELAYPLCGFTFALLPVDGANRLQRRAVARFLWWATHDGQRFAPQLGLGALPGELAVRDEDMLRSLRGTGEPAL
jgi:phosphate transport system substrate-binding protein